MAERAMAARSTWKLESLGKLRNPNRETRRISSGDCTKQQGKEEEEKKK